MPEGFISDLLIKVKSDVFNLQIFLQKGKNKPSCPPSIPFSLENVTHGCEPVLGQRSS